MSLAAEHASGDVRLYARGTTKRATFDGDTHVLSGGVVGAYGLIGIIQGSVDLGSDGTPATTTETTLKTWDLPAGALATDDQGIRMHAFGSFAANANDKTVRIKFGATTVLTYAGSSTGTGGGGWRAQVDLFRTGGHGAKSDPVVGVRHLELGGPRLHDHHGAYHACGDAVGGRHDRGHGGERDRHGRRHRLRGILRGVSAWRVT